jgi:SH3 domain-containing YSC84-like protein 1
MRGNIRLGWIAAALVAAFAGAEQASAKSEEATIRASTEVLSQFLALRVKEIPEALLSEAEGVAIIPDLIKVGFVVGGQRGTGIVVVKDPKTGGWTAPSFISLTGGSIGWQIGAQSSDIVLVFKTRRSVEGLLEGKFTLGADAAVAAGPVGRQAKAATDGQLKAEIYSYSRARGLFAGVAIDGSVLQIEHEQNAAYYGGAGVAGVAQPIPESALKLVEYIAQATSAAQQGGLVGQPNLEQPRDGGAGTRLTPARPIDAVPSQPIPANPIPSTPTPATPLPQGGASGPALAPPRPLSMEKPDADALRAEAARSYSSLAPLLDASWQRYLALPAELYDRGRHPSPTALRASIERFDAVAADARYRELNTRAEFHATRDMLKAYLDVLSAGSSPRLALPPPPGSQR